MRLIYYLTNWPSWLFINQNNYNFKLACTQMIILIHRAVKCCGFISKHFNHMNNIVHHPRYCFISMSKSFHGTIFWLLKVFKCSILFTMSRITFHSIKQYFVVFVQSSIIYSFTYYAHYYKIRYQPKERRTIWASIQPLTATKLSLRKFYTVFSYVRTILWTTQLSLWAVKPYWYWLLKEYSILGVNGTFLKK